MCSTGDPTIVAVALKDDHIKSFIEWKTHVILTFDASITCSSIQIQRNYEIIISTHPNVHIAKLRISSKASYRHGVN